MVGLHSSRFMWLPNAWYFSFMLKHITFYILCLHPANKYSNITYSDTQTVGQWHKLLGNIYNKLFAENLLFTLGYECWYSMIEKLILIEPRCKDFDQNFKNLYLLCFYEFCEYKFRLVHLVYYFQIPIFCYLSTNHLRIKLFWKILIHLTPCIFLTGLLLSFCNGSYLRTYFSFFFDSIP